MDSRSEASLLSLIKTAVPHIPPMTSIAPCWYVLLTIYSCPWNALQYSHVMSAQIHSAGGSAPLSNKLASRAFCPTNINSTAQSAG